MLWLARVVYDTVECRSRLVLSFAFVHFPVAHPLPNDRDAAELVGRTPAVLRKCCLGVGSSGPDSFRRQSPTLRGRAPRSTRRGGVPSGAPGDGSGGALRA